MVKVRDYTLIGEVWYEGEPYPVRNSFLIYGQPSTAQLYAELAEMNIYPYSPDGRITLLATYKTMESKAYMTLKNFREWFKELVTPPEEPGANGYMAYFYTILVKPNHCYGLLDFSVCVPNNVDVDELLAVTKGTGLRPIQWFGSYRDRIDVGIKGECVPSDEWIYELMAAIDGVVFYEHAGGEKRGEVCK